MLRSIAFRFFFFISSILGNFLNIESPKFGDSFGSERRVLGPSIDMTWVARVAQGTPNHGSHVCVCLCDC